MYKSTFGQDVYEPYMKWERTVTWQQTGEGNGNEASTNDSWRTDPDVLSATCSNDGFSWPHRTLGWKMLKDDLFGIDFTGNPIGVGMTRTYAGTYDTGTGSLDTAATKLDDYVDANLGHLKSPAHDLDSVCLDCHNPTIWNATSASHADTAATSADDMNDELLLRGLP